MRCGVHHAIDVGCSDPDDGEIAFTSTALNATMNGRSWPLTLRAFSLNERPLTRPMTAHFDAEGGSVGRADP